MKILIAPDSFKGSLEAKEVAKAIERGIQIFDPSIETIRLPVADGGEGTLDVLVEGTAGSKYTIEVTDPLEGRVQATYGVLGDGQTVVIEIAEAAGLTLVSKKQLNPLYTTTYGVGELIRCALDKGYRRFIVGLGGSATNDGGAGMLQALGLKLLDAFGNDIPLGGGSLHKIKTIDQHQFDERIFESTFLIASDVENPFIGETGASAIFGPQKGATEEMVAILDRNLHHFANQIEGTVQQSIHHKKGAGAAGGLGGAFQAFFPSVTQNGIELVLEVLRFNEHVQNVDLVISGEGKIDAQTAYGKTPFGVAKAAKKHGVSTFLIGGIVEKPFDQLYEEGIATVMSITNKPMSVQEAMGNAAILIEEKIEQCMRLYFMNRI